MAHTVSYTAEDIQNAFIYAAERTKLLAIEYEFKHLAKNIISELEYSIEQAPLELYYYPSTFAKRAIVVSVSISGKLCEKISCNTATREGGCDSLIRPRNFYIGDTGQWETACQFSCFNLKPVKTITDADSIYNIQSIRTIWDDNLKKCKLTPSGLLAWLEQPIYRSKERFTMRLNDLVLGFNRKQDPKTWTGFNYEFNQYYCDAYYKDFDPKTKSCTVPWYETFLDAVIGMSFINLIRTAVDFSFNGGTIPPLPANLPDIPTYTETLEEWRNDINESFIVPNPNSDVPIGAKLAKSYISPVAKKFQKIKLSNRNDYVPNQISIEHRRRLDEEYRKRSDTVTCSNDEPTEKVNITDILTDVFTELLHMFFTTEFYIYLGYSVAFDTAVQTAKRLIIQFSNFIIPKLATVLNTMIGKFGMNLLRESLRVTVAAAMSTIISQTASKLAMFLAKSVTQMASIVGIILMAIGILDLLISFWDPFGFNNAFDPSIFQSLIFSSEFAMREQIGTDDVSFTFEILTNLMIEPDANLEIQLNSLPYILEYMNSLVVNSEGSFIDKGKVIEINIVNEDVLYDEYSDTLAKLTIYSEQELEQYEEKFKSRIKLTDLFKKIAQMFLVGGLIFLPLQMPFVALILLIIAMILYLLMQLCWTTDRLFNVVDDSMMTFLNGFSRISKYLNS